MKKKLRHLVRRPRDKTAIPDSEIGQLEQAASAVPRITTETIAAHREDVLGSARKYIYPLQHSKHKIVLISTSLLIAAVVGFFSYCLVALYRLQSTSPFLYRVTQVIPFPIAKAGPDYVAYENYLFELGHYTYYYQTQQKLDFKSDAGRQQLADYKKKALNQVIDEAYVKQLAHQNHVSVTNRELDDEITVVRNQNRLGASDQSFEEALKANFGWSVSDFKRSLKQQLLAQKLVSALDKDTHEQAQAALNELGQGADFAAVAKKYSDDPTNKDNGGEFGFLVDKTNRDLSAQTVNALFKLKPGQVSGIVNIGYGLEIVKNIQSQDNKIRGAHILFNFKDINDYLNPLKDKEKTRLFVRT